MFFTRSAFAVFLYTMAWSLPAQTPPRTSAEFSAALGFEVPLQNGMPRSWTGGPAETIALDRDTFQSGETSARIRRETGRSDSFSGLTAAVPVDFAGEKVELVGYLGGISTRFSGLGVFYPNGAPTQRIGIVPDVVVAPTVEGIRAGRDEVLERALSEISTRSGAAPTRP